MKASQLQETAQAEAANWFHSLEPVVPGDMVGLWKGDGYPSGHPLDGVLENLHWFGKRFHPDMRADALLFEGEPGRLVPVDPKFFPIRLANRFAVFGRSAGGWNLFQHVRPRVWARGPTASLQMRMDDNVMTAAMVYDRQPITDYFRRIDEKQVAGGNGRSVPCKAPDENQRTMPIQVIVAQTGEPCAGSVRIVSPPRCAASLPIFRRSCRRLVASTVEASS